MGSQDTLPHDTVPRDTVPYRLSRRSFLLLWVAGLLAAALSAVVPVSVRFGDDPLLRVKGRLDPQLSAPAPRADCGPPATNLSSRPGSTDLFDVARASACADAARRRVSAGVAVAGILVALGLLGLYGASQARHR